MVQDSDRRHRTLGGWLAIAIGLGVSVLVARQPQHLHAPAWVVYVAAAAFVCAGIAILARADPRINAFFCALTVAGLLVPGAWAALAPGSRECSISLSFLPEVAPSAVCRVAFGLGALIVAPLFVVLLLRALRSDRAG